VHYLRTTNPAGPEGLAVYPRRIATNRPNPYTFPDAFKSLASGMLSYETRQCASGPMPTLVTEPQPGLPIDPTTLIPPALAANVQKFFFGASGAVAPPCTQQPKFPFGGEVTQYPHVNVASGATARALARTAQTRRTP
jgi:phospholipid/cholesterol/gamma-HCH transport system substrate-binding protein